MQQTTGVRPNGWQRMVPELIASEATRLEPFAWLKEMRDRSPIRFDESRDCWDVFQYDHILQVLQNWETFSSTERPKMEGLPVPSMITMDPPRHTKLRGLVAKAFTQSEIVKWIPVIESVAQTLIEDLRGKDEIDLVLEYSYQLPIIVISEMIGVPKEDRLLFKKWISTTFASVNGDEAEGFVTTEDKLRASQEIGGYFAQLIAERRLQPKGDIITQLTQAEIDGERLTDQELLDFCFLMMIAGFETTTNLIANSTRVLIDVPDVADRLRADLSLVPQAIEEVLRYRSPVMTLQRHVMQEVEFHGHVFQPRDQVVIWTLSGNRDERHWAQADQYLLDRNPHNHLGFGHGHHFCLGSQLARLEGKVAITKLLEATKGIEYADLSRLKPTSSQVTHGIDVFPLKLTFK